MERIENQKLLKELSEKAEEIRNECSLLKKTIKASAFADDTDTTVFSDFSEYLQTLFDEFSRIANQIHALEDPEELDLLKKDIAVFYSRFIKMQNQLRIIDAPQYDLSSDDDDWNTDDSSLDDEEDAVSEETEELLEDDFSEEYLTDPPKSKKKKKKSYKFPARATTIETLISEQSRSSCNTEESDRLEEQYRQDAMRYEQYRKNQEQQALYNQRFDEQNGNSTLQSLSLSEQKAESERRRIERQRKDQLAETDSDKIRIRKVQSEIVNYAVSDSRAPNQHFNYNVLTSQEEAINQAHRNPKKESTEPAIISGSVPPFQSVNYTTFTKTNERSKSDSPDPSAARALLNMAAISGALTNAFTAVTASHRYSQLDQYQLQRQHPGTDVHSGNNRNNQENGNRTSRRAGASKDITPQVNTFAGNSPKNDPWTAEKKPLLFNDCRRKPWEPDRPGKTSDRRKEPWEPDRPGKTSDRRKEPWEPDRPGKASDRRKGPWEPDRPGKASDRGKEARKPDRPGKASDYRGHDRSTNPNRVFAEAEEIRAAEKKLDRQQKSKRITYTLKSVTSEIGYGITATVRTAGQRYLDKLDNDVIRYAMKADYYRYIGSAAIGVAQGMLKNPASDLRLNATAELSSRQMAKYNAAAIRNGKNLKEQIENAKAKYDALSPKDKNGVKGKELRNQIHKLKSQIPSSNKAAAVAQNVQSFQHERVLDQKVLNALSDKNGKVSKRLKTIDARGNEFLKVQRNQMQKRFDARYQVLSNEKAQDQIRKLTKAAQAKKLQIRLLERQGARLSAADKAKLITLKADLKANGKEIGKLKSLLQNRSDLAYLEKQVGSVVQRARKYKQNKKTLAGLVRSTMLRPLYNPENNTEYLAKAISLPFNPLVQSGVRLSYQVAKATVSVPVKVVSAGTKKFTPDIYNHFHFAQDQFAAWKQQLKKASRKELYLQKKRVWDSLPEGMQNYWKQIRHKIDACKKVNVEFHQRIRRMKEWAEKTRLMRLRRAAQRKLKQITEYFQKAGRLFRAVCIKGLVAVILVGVIAAAIPTFSAIISTYFSSIIASPNETEDGKIDLSPYTAIINNEKQKFSAQRADLESAFTEEVEKKTEQFNQRYNNPPKSQFLEIDEYTEEDSKITVSFDGPSENSRELIAMMAVRFEQDLENPDATKYLKYIAGKSRTLVTASDKTWQHDPGCVLVRTMVSDDSKPTPKPPKPTPGGGGGSHVIPGIRSKPSAVRSSGGSHVVVPTPGGGSHIVVPTPDGGSHVVVPTDPTEPAEQEFIDHWVCPGHREMEIHIHVLTLEELYAADDYVGGIDGWEGWTEDNKEWVQLMLDMDWGELYSGFHAGGGFIGSISTKIPPEIERHIWDYLSNFTGNEYAAAGIMGNLLAESGLLSTNLQDKYEDIVGYTDDTYTTAVDNGTYTNFISDSAGYGLAQWTDKGRKEKLYNFAKSRNASIGDLDMQLNYLAKEMRDWPMMDQLTSFGSIEEASNYILDVFERPRDPEATRATRIRYSSYFYNKYVLGISAEGDLTQAQRDVIDIATNSAAYGVAARKGYCQAWAAHVYSRAGFALDNSSCARMSGERFGVSSDFTCVPPGAAVYGYSSSKYGHVGIYVGGGLVYDCIGDNDVMESSLDWWINRYNGFCWGWEGGTDLTALP